ncbi:MAG: TetR/AcrR family transcriptional regulator [Bacteroidota bacterium]
MSKSKGISKAERTRQFIIEKAAPIFNKKGYTGSSLSELVKETGLTKGAIYGNFKNKDEIAAAAFEFNLARIREVIELSNVDEENAVKKLLRIPEFYRKKARELGASGGCPILNTAVEADDNNSLLYKHVRQTVSHWTSNIEKIINEGKTKKQIRDDVSATELAVVIISLIEGGIMLTMIMNEATQLMTALDKVESLIREAAK